MLYLSGLLVKATSYFLVKCAIIARRRNYETLGRFHVSSLLMEICKDSIQIIIWRTPCTNKLCLIDIVLAFHVFGAAGKMAIEVSMIGFLGGTCIAFFVVMGDLAPPIIAGHLGIDNSEKLRIGVLLGKYLVKLNLAW